ncbi:hypothetical protein HYH03_006354 [Edaphochlamys debaryana]|uniref:Uncharacterized protein n=1 Tax=Edaphochlamys debaryana TaxID=47281 RepID=A0A835Y3L7_9CHLO|nr:hypothetical protein HYH03_006354 [Edaphochlamys debaryana]|eukprot:KAG2495405.1 hypothetical protein HYH03_006354 [Edaphochlamys debaryana]
MVGPARSHTPAATTATAAPTASAPTSADVGAAAADAALQLSLLVEEALRRVAAAALKESGLYVKEEWVRDLLCDSVVADLQEGGCTAGEDDAYGRFQALLYEQLPQAEDDEVRGFAAALHRHLGEALEAAAAAAAGGSGGSDDEEEGPIGGCALCERQMPLTFHHLIPKDVHSRYKKRGLLSTEQLSTGVDICRACHSAIHRTYDNKTLAAQYGSLEALKQSEPLMRFVEWARKQKVRVRPRKL